MAPYLTGTLALFSLGAILFFYLANSDVAQNLSPQGCRMSWMSPSYVLQSGFDSSWSPLARRYSLWLYREVGWDSNHIQGVPVLFIPGNAGSSHQVRSIASSATRQFYSSPQVISSEFSSGRLKPLDFFAVEFNEDLSAFHGSTIESQILYTSRAMDYILSLYPANTSIIIMGHSMGGVVATALLPSKHISAIITMSTPHTLPPARFDSRIDELYRRNRLTLDSDPTPILSLCGGAADMMIPSESCVLQTRGPAAVFRRTIFTSALEGAWTGVGHREMVWCHQVRWRVARAALELGAGPSSSGILDAWLRDGHILPSSVLESGKGGRFSLPNPGAYEILPLDMRLDLKNPRSSQIYLLPLPEPSSSASFLKAVIFVSQGSIPPVSPQNRIPLGVTIFYCAASPVLEEAGPICNPLQPSSLRLIPNPVAGKPFPVPDEGSDESEGVVLYEADIPILDDEAGKRWLGVRLADADGRGWVIGGFSPVDPLTNGVSTLSLLIGKATVMLPDKNALRTQVAFPNLLSSALLIYRITPRQVTEDPHCSNPLLSPLIMHTSQLSETHYYPMGSPDRRILLHTHNPGPYVPWISGSGRRSLDFVIYLSGSTGCGPEPDGFTIEVDWSATMGRWASRYPTTLASWAVGVVAFVMFEAWGLSDKDHAMPTVDQSLSTYGRKTLQKLMLASFLISFLPLPVDYYLGNKGEVFFTPIAPLLLLVASGLVFVSWWVLTILMWSLGKVGRIFFGRHRRREERSVRRSTVISMGLIFLVIFLFIPWQVAYLGCWLIHLFTCAMSGHLDPLSNQVVQAVPVIPLIRVRDTDDDTAKDEDPIEITHHEARRGPSQYLTHTANNNNNNMHLLLLMTWLLPFAAPVLAVWVRTLVTAGLTTPFDGDHSFLDVSPFLILVDFASWHSGALFERQSFENTLSTRWCLAFLAWVAFFIGPRKAYNVFDASKVAIGLIVVVRIGRRYWGGESWSDTVHRLGR